MRRFDCGEEDHVVADCPGGEGTTDIGQGERKKEDEVIQRTTGRDLRSKKNKQR